MRRSPSSYHRPLSRTALVCPLVLTAVFLFRAQERVDAQNKVHYRFSQMRIMAFLELNTVWRELSPSAVNALEM